ncbi:hypothetical protein EFK07_02125 [Pseudomonas putida]|uniref:Uncharacterized protein n=1 Tax=Pseudomonas putida TaxID=303 RepID=A0A3M8TKA3_PSEPU|nr:hypothetical protein EFK07_02125 [Pseudomonas putida]
MAKPCITASAACRVAKNTAKTHRNRPDLFPGAPMLCDAGDRTVTDECRVTVKQKPRRLPGRGSCWLASLIQHSPQAYTSPCGSGFSREHRQRRCHPPRWVLRG